MFCTNCGKQINDDAKFCRYCGQTFENKKQKTINKNILSTNKETNIPIRTNKPINIKKLIIPAVVVLAVISGLFFFFNGKGNTKTTGENGWVIKEELFYRYGELSEKNVYEYDDDWNLITMNNYNSNGKIWQTYTYENDSEGRMKKIKSLGINGKAYYTYEYDENGNRTKESMYNDESLNDIIYSYSYKYDSEGNLIKQEMVDYTGRTISTEIEYDLDGKKVKEETEDSNKEKKYLTEYEYDKKGKLTKQINYFGEKITGWKEYKTDKKGNILVETEYTIEGEEKNRKERKYDSNNNLTQLRIIEKGEETDLAKYKYIKKK